MDNNTISNLPKLRPIKPRRPLHAFDRLIVNLEEARGLYETILGHQTAFKERVAGMPGVKVRPDVEGTPLRDFAPTDPLQEWFDVTDQRYQIVAILEKQGLIATIRLGGRFFSRPA